MPRSAPTFRSFVAAGIPTDKKERSAFVKQLAEARVKSGEAKTMAGAVRSVQRRITDAGQQRGQSAPISKQERSAARSFFKAHSVQVEKVAGSAARSDDPKYRLAVEKYKDREDALDRAAELKEGIETAPGKTGKSDSPTLIDHAKQIEIDFVPEGGRYPDGPESSARNLTAPPGGIYVLTLRGD